MCHNVKKISQTKNGLLLKCSHCDIYQLVFNNLNFNFNKKELTGFCHYIDDIDEDFWEEEYKFSIYKKKIPIQTLQSNFIILLDRNELYELRSLLHQTSFKYERISFNEIGYELFMN